MTVRVYRWDDASAPVLTGEVGKLSALLKACLVTGYGSKTAAGWSNPYSATNVEAFTNSVAAGGTGYGIKVTNTSAQSATVFAYKTIDGSGALTEQFPTTAQLANGVYFFYSNTADATARPWMIVADETRFYFWSGASLTTASGLSSITYMGMYFAGDPIRSDPADPYAFTLIGSTSSSDANSFGANHATVSATAMPGHYVSRDYAGTTISKQCGKVAGCFANATAMGTSGPTYPDPITGGMLLSPVFMHDAEATNVVRGRLPGLYNPIHNLPGSPGDTFTGVGALAGKTFVLLDASASGYRCRVALEISDTWS